MFCVLSLLGAWWTGCSSAEPTTEESPQVDNPSEESWPEVPFTLLSVSVVGDSLTAVVQYGGGCGSHAFFLDARGPMLKSLPPKQPLRLVHRSSGDPCRALVLDTVRHDLTPFRGTPHGTTILTLESWDPDLPYTYR